MSPSYSILFPVFDRAAHDGIMDDIRDMEFLASHQDELQGKHDSEVEFATTLGGPTSTKKTCLLSR